MLCFEVRLNGEKVALAGVEDGVATVILTAVSRTSSGPPESSESPRSNLNIGGLSQNTHLDWPEPSVHIGDRIEILIVEAENPDPPVRRRREPAEEREQSERRYYERLKQKYES